MTDLISLIITFVCFVLAVAYAGGCERLKGARA